jgi:hypothetical protein
LCHSSQTALLSQTSNVNTLLWKRSQTRLELHWRRVDEYDYEEIMRIAQEEWNRGHWYDYANCTGDYANCTVEEEFATEVHNKNDELGQTQEDEVSDSEESVSSEMSGFTDSSESETSSS